MFQICSYVSDLMVLCIGSKGAGKTLLLSLLEDKTFNPDTCLVPTVGVNIFTLHYTTEVGKKRAEIQVRELGGELCPLWSDYLKIERNVIFVINSQDLSRAGLVAIKLCEALSSLEEVSRESNRTCRLVVVWTRAGDITTFSRILRLRQLVRDSSVLCSEIVFDIESLAGLSSLRDWVVQCQ